MDSVLNGEPLDFKFDTEYHLICCDCGLNHLVIFRRVNKNTVQMRFWRDDYNTQAGKKKHKKRRK